MISVPAVSFECNSFMEQARVAVTRRAVVVMPLKVIESINDRGETEHLIFSGCNLHYSCQAENCMYSKFSRDKARQNKESGKYARV